MRLMILLLAWCCGVASAQTSGHGEALQADLANVGRDPVEFAVSALRSHELLIFDDAVHNADDPWRFYQTLVEAPAFNAQLTDIFVETLPVNEQPRLDAYFNTYPANPNLLLPAFQSGAITGWNYRSYVDLFATIHAINADRDPVDRIRVHAVSTPAYWAQIQTPADFRTYIGPAQAGRDAHMYAIIYRALDQFTGTRRGMFLTNTRHAYNGLHRSDGSLIWNTATYFKQWHPGHSLSIRFNGPFLNIERRGEDSARVATAEGLENIEYSWVRADSGQWDRAFAQAGDGPVAIPLTGTEFGTAPYIGNLMLNAAAGQTMADVYDAVIHLGPVTGWQNAADYAEIYTPEFKREVARRYQAAYSPEDLSAFLASQNVADLEALTSELADGRPVRPLPQALAVGPLPQLP
ncbi:hypothetical protein [Maricaulis sp.]|uniref:hypothetical protein n=1 Tax=Maricaulis sp. TaxID=1486257 RepID=UPI003A8D4F4A